MIIVTFDELKNSITSLENCCSKEPELFNKLYQAWTTGRPIKESIYELENLFIGIEHLKEKITKCINTELTPGGIYSIYSDKEQSGIGKSQFAHSLQKEFEKKFKNRTDYLYLRPSEEGFKDLRSRLNNCYIKCNKIDRFYFFIDEIDLISEPNLTDNNLAKRIDTLENILVEIADNAYHESNLFFIFLILSKKIQNNFERIKSQRIIRRIYPFVAVDIKIDKDDIETFATRFFSLLWVKDHRNIKSKLSTEESKYKFIEKMTGMITVFSENLNYLGLNTESSVIGDYIIKFRTLFDIIFDGVTEQNVIKSRFDNDTEVGNKVHDMLKEYLLEKNKVYTYNEDTNQISIIYDPEQKLIWNNKTDGYYKFLIGDTEIGIMPVEITTDKNFKEDRKKKQLKSFLANADTILIWLFPKSKQEQFNKELEYLKEKISDDAKFTLNRVIIPKDFVKYALLLEERKFSYLEALRDNLSNNIKTYLFKFAKYKYDDWLIIKPASIKTKDRKKIEKIDKEKGKDKEEKEEDKEKTIFFTDIGDKVKIMLQKFLGLFNDCEKQKKHGIVKQWLKDGINNLNEGLKLKADVLDLDIIYGEFLQKMKSNNLCRFNSIGDTSFLIKDKFDLKIAVTESTPIIMQRIKDTGMHEI